MNMKRLYCIHEHKDSYGNINQEVYLEINHAQNIVIRHKDHFTRTINHGGGKEEEKIQKLLRNTRMEKSFRAIRWPLGIAEILYRCFDSMQVESSLIISSQVCMQDLTTNKEVAICNRKCNSYMIDMKG